MHYGASSGMFLDREWGHSEAINGICLVDDEDGTRKIVSVGSDGMIMVWVLDMSDSSLRAVARDPSPVKEASTSGRQTLRKVLSKAELTEFQRPPAGGRRSPPRSLKHRSSRLSLSANSGSIRTPTGTLQGSPGNGAIMEDTPLRWPPNGNQPDSPPPSPKLRGSKTPSLSALGKSARKKSSGSNLGGFGSLNMATEQACRTLRAYRRKLSSAEPITAEELTELDHELRLTAAALGDRAIRNKTMSETVLSGLLDRYSERLVLLLDEKVGLSHRPKERGDGNSSGERRCSSADSSSSS